MKSYLFLRTNKFFSQLNQQNIKLKEAEMILQYKSYRKEVENSKNLLKML